MIKEWGECVGVISVFREERAVEEVHDGQNEVGSAVEDVFVDEVHYSRYTT